MNCNNWFSEYSEHVSCSFVWHQSSRTFQKAPNLKQSRATKIKIRLCHQDSRFLPTAIRFTGSLLGKNGYLPPPGHWDLKPKISRRPEVRSLIPIKWLNSCIDSLFAYMTLTLHKNQAHYSGFMQWWACNSLASAPLPAEAGCETSKRIVLSLVVIAKQ